MAAHGHARATKDLDVWVEPTADNAARVMAALANFGAPLAGLVERDLATPHYGFMMGAPPRRVDVLTAVDGLDFAESWQRRVVFAVADGQTAPFLSLEDLIANKQAAGRRQELADVAALLRRDR